MSFAKRLIALREAKGWSQYDIAERLNIKRPRYNAWEQGLSKPRADLLNNLAALLEVSTDYLLSGDQGAGSEPPTPEWATAKDKRDLKRIIEDEAPLMFDGMPIEGDSKQRIIDILTGLFWEAKALNKETYGRKKKDTDDK